MEVTPGVSRRLRPGYTVGGVGLRGSVPSPVVNPVFLGQWAKDDLILRAGIRGERSGVLDNPGHADSLGGQHGELDAIELDDVGGGE